MAFKSEIHLQSFVKIRCKTFFRKHPMYKKYLCYSFVLKIRMLSFFPVVQMTANYVKFDRVGRLEADFRSKLKFSQCCHKTSIIQNQQRNVKKKKKKKKKSLYYRNCIGQTNSWQ